MTFFFSYLINRVRKSSSPAKPMTKRRKTLELVKPDQSKEEHEEALTEAKKQQKSPKQREIADPCLILELPTCILADILSRLSFKSVCLCRCVCTTWCSVISSPDFNSFWSERADTEIFLRSDSAIHASRFLHLVDFKTVSASVPPRDWLERREIGIEMKVCLPKRHRKVEIIDSFTKKSFFSKREYDIVNSCNGLLCLRKSSSIHCSKNPCIVCNPFTGELINIPKPEKSASMRNWEIVSGFGCSSKNNEYKIVRLVYRHSALNPFNRMTEVYTLGTNAWRTVGNAPWDTLLESFNVFLNGNIHWLSAGSDTVKFSILCFDFDHEQFNVFPFPPNFVDKLNDDLSKSQLCIGVLRQCLFVSGVTCMNQLDIWVMNDYGKQESWTKEFSLSLNIFPGTICRPIKRLENGDLVLLWTKMSLLFYSPMDKKVRLFKIRGAESVAFEAISHIPTSVSMKDIVGGDSQVVENANSSRWSVSELREEAKAVSLVEERNEGLDWALNIW